MRSCTARLLAARRRFFHTVTRPAVALARHGYSSSLQKFSDELVVLQLGIMFLFILAILGTFFFRNQDMDNFGTMFRTSYTLFLALAFGEWSVLSVIEDGYINWGRLIYLMLVVFFLVWITTNVIITILLDKFVQVCVPVSLNPKP